MEEILQSIDEDTKRKFSKAPGYTLEYILHALEWIFEQEYQGRKLAYQMFVDVMKGEHPVNAMKKAGLRI